MQTIKMSLENIKGKLSRAEMKSIMAGLFEVLDETCNCNSADDCTANNEMCINGCSGKPGDKYQGICGCS